MTATVEKPSLRPPSLIRIFFTSPLFAFALSISMAFLVLGLFWYLSSDSLHVMYRETAQWFEAFCAIAGMFLLGALVNVLYLKSIYDAPILISGKIIAASYNIKGPNSLDYQYNYLGKEYRGTKISYRSSFQAGDIITVAISPKNPGFSDLVDLYYSK